MKIAVCLDDKGGMMFNHRRQSRDRVVSADILELAKGARLLMSPYSARLFAESEDSITVCEDPLARAQKGDVCFVEDSALVPYVHRLDEVVIYRWNRVYPADAYFDIDLAARGFVCVEVSEFEGYSHEKITKEIFRK